MNEITKRLETEGYRFNFYQAIRLLESLFRDRPQIGHIGPYEQEVVKIRPNDELTFAPADICRVERRETEEVADQWLMSENFLGLYGPNTASPIYIAEMIAQFPGEDDALRDFLDIFNHRILSLYYRAWKKHSIIASVSPDRDDPFSNMLLSMIGKDSESSIEDWIVAPHRLLRFSSFLCSASRSGYGLEQLIGDFFELDDVKVIQFVSRRFKLTDPSFSQLGGEGGQLGVSLVLGDTITDISGQFTVRLGSLSMQQFLDFQPGMRKYRELMFLTNLYVKHRLGCRLELVLSPGQGGPAELSSLEPTAVLGRSAWMGVPAEGETSASFEVEFNI